MAVGNIKIREANGDVSETMAAGDGTPSSPKIPHFGIMDPYENLHLRLEETEYGKTTLPVHAEHVHTSPFNTHMAQAVGSATTLTAAASKNTYQLTLASVAGLSVGNKIQIRSATTREIDYRRIQAINGLVINIDARLDNDYAIGDEVQRFTLDLDVAGTLASPNSFLYIPRPGKIQHLENFVVYIRSSTQPYLSQFGDLAGLTNGVHFRKYNGTDGTFQTMDIFRINQRFVQSGWTVEFGDRAAPADSYSTIATFNQLDVMSAMFRLVEANGDYFEVLVQDDLTGLAGFEIKVSGHEEI